jgi:Short C-terminal domain
MMRRRGPGLVRTMARTAVVAGTASAVSGRVHHRQNERWQAEAAEQQAAADAAALQQQIAAQQSQQAQAALTGQASAPDLTAQLEQLAQLRQSGILTDEEFAAAKAKLLA